MNVRDMFEQLIGRDIKGVITVGEETEGDIYKELEEYVVTKELDKHFHDFTAAFCKALDGPTDKMGIWVSGFFGSGKSHFLKMLAHLLKNQTVSCKTALQFFEQKINDPTLIADLGRIVNSGTMDVVIFNIDSKSSSDSKSNKEAIVEVLNKVFNQMRGFSGEVPWLADLEARMVKDGTYEDFKKAYHGIAGSPWETGQDLFYYDRDSIVEALAKTTRMSQSSAEKWYDDGEKSYSLSIEKFSRKVKEYCDSKGKNHRIVFLIDEVGQYIGDNTDLMLNLQTVVEDLGKMLGGRAWIIVTSQEAIDLLTTKQIKGRDFSKIMGRFATRLNLSSANTDEVIKRRLLVKTDVARQTLEALYGEKSPILRNQISFSSGTAEMKGYADVKDFVEVYPFIPYQFKLMQRVFEQIRRMGATGKHLSEGERSMLSSFQEAAVAIGDQPVGAMVPLSCFYDSLDSFLDTSVSRVIQQAAENSHLQPQDIALLKILFMIKYVKEIKPSVENLTTLSLSHCDQDKVALRKQIQESLDRLVLETLVQKAGDEFIFLTDDEQDVNREIKSTEIDQREVIDYISNVVFDEIYGENKYKYAWTNFPFNRKVDEVFRGSQTNELILWIMTPLSGDHSLDPYGIASKTMGLNAVLLVLPGATSFIDDAQELKQTDKFLRYKTGTAVQESVQQILESKRSEMRQIARRVKEALESEIAQAEVFITGQKKEVSGDSPKARIEAALKILVENTYNKFDYIQQSVIETVEIARILKSDDVQQMTMYDWEVNKQALNEVERYIAEQDQRNLKITLKSLSNNFTHIPYGWSELDIAALVARLMVADKITARYKGEPIPRKDPAMVGYLTKAKEYESLTISRKIEIDKLTIDKVKKVMREVTGRADWSSKEDELFEAVQQELQSQAKDLQGFQIRYERDSYPGEKVVAEAATLLKQLLDCREPKDLFESIKDQESAMLDYAEDMHSIRGFFSNQVNIWNDAVERHKFFRANELHLGESSKTALTQIQEILGMPQPYGRVKDLPSLVSKVEKDYQSALEREKQNVRTEIEQRMKAVADVLEAEAIESSQHAEVLGELNQALHSLDAMNDCNQAVALLKHVYPMYERALETIEKLKHPNIPPVPGDPPAPPKSKTVHLNSMLPSPKIIGSEKDIEDFLDELRSKLKAQMEEGRKIRLI